MVFNLFTDQSSYYLEEESETLLQVTSSRSDDDLGFSISNDAYVSFEIVTQSDNSITLRIKSQQVDRPRLANLRVTASLGDEQTYLDLYFSINNTSATALVADVTTLITSEGGKAAFEELADVADYYLKMAYYSKQITASERENITGQLSATSVLSVNQIEEDYASYLEGDISDVELNNLYLSALEHFNVSAAGFWNLLEAVQAELAGALPEIDAFSLQVDSTLQQVSFFIGNPSFGSSHDAQWVFLEQYDFLGALLPNVPGFGGQCLADSSSFSANSSQAL
ncbi:hypothetical protein [Agarivorans gilvus]|nr:hypothetical protein [Agarivorans gilvus]